MIFPSKLIEESVAVFSKFPGIGKKTALRLVMYLLQADKEVTKKFTETLHRMRNEIKYCKTCHNVSDDDVCSICSSTYRDKSTVCVVENFRDILAIEQTQQYNGVYHVLEGLISPLDGIGPEQLNIHALENRVKENQISELIMALNPTIDGDTTIFYISKKFKNYPIKITTISRGIAFGGELEYVDEITLARSIQARLPYENYLKN
jgi:recombination protein RecR